MPESLSHPLTAVINVRNGEVYIEETLKSLLGQATPVNILVVDNHSTDRTSEIVARYPRVQFVRTPEPMTLGAARAYSLGLVNSEFIAWIDSDDLWDPTFANHVTNALRKNPNAVIGTAGTVSIDTHGDVIGHRDSYHRKYCIPFWKRNPKKTVRADSFAGILVRMRPKWAWCAHVFRTAAVKEVGGFDSTLVYSVDLDLIARLLRLGDAVHVQDNLTRYRRHPQQDTQRQKPETIYGEKLLVTRRLALETGALSPQQLSQMEQLTQMKCAATYFFRKPRFESFFQVFRAAFNTEILRYYWRLLRTP